MCSACAERDVPFGRDVCFASDVRFAREDAEHITSLCAAGAIHHCALALYHYGEAITSLFTTTPKYAIINPERRCYNEKSIFFFAFALHGSFAYFLSGQLVWKPFRCSVVFYSCSGICSVYCFVSRYDFQDVCLP